MLRLHHYDNGLARVTQDAIAALLNQSFQSHGIQANVTRSNAHLDIALYSDRPVDPQYIDRLTRGLQRLNVPNCRVYRCGLPNRGTDSRLGENVVSAQRHRPLLWASNSLLQSQQKQPPFRLLPKNINNPSIRRKYIPCCSLPRLSRFG
jgi:hypothetical protein